MGLINAGRPSCETSRGGRLLKHPGNNAPIRGGEVDAENWCARSGHTKDLIPALTRFKTQHNGKTIQVFGTNRIYLPDYGGNAYLSNRSA